MVQVALLGSVVALLAVWPAYAHHGGKPYEGLFRQMISQYWRDTPHTWQLLDALADAESSYRPNIVSHAGAIGLMQVMPGTWREMRSQGIPIGEDPTDPRDNIRAGSYYLRRMYRIFTDERRTEDDRLRVSAASYNAGPGNLIKAQKLAVAGGEEGVTFDEMGAALPRVTGSHAAGTIAYSNKIVSNYRTSQAVVAPREAVAVDTVATAPLPNRASPEPSPPIVHVVIQQEPPTDWSQLIGLLYIILSGGKRDDRDNPTYT